jgi:MFS family permease
MSKLDSSRRADSENDDTFGAENVPLRDLRRTSVDSIASSNFDRLLEDDNSDASSTDSPQVDGGRGAWLCLLGCWLVEALIWSFPLAFGIFQDYYSKHELFRDSTAIPTIGTLATGVSYLGMPFANMVVVRWPQHKRTMCVTGWFMCIAGLVIASFAKDVRLLLLSQGLLYGLGWVVCYTPFFFILNTWWVFRRGFAYGILFSASGVLGLAIPGVVGWLLQRFGFKIALRAYATAIICASGPGLFLIRPRVPDIKYENVQSAELRPKRVLEHVARSPHTYILALAVFIQGLGFFIPNLYIASFSSALGLPTSSGAGLLALISLSQVLGQISQGWASDHVNIYIPLSLSALLPGLGAIFLWGPAKDMSRLVPFAILWGLFSSSYSVLLPGICSFLAREVNLAGGDSVTMLLYGILSFERGLANILEGPVSSWLLGGQGDGPTIDKAKFGLGQYAAVVWFTSICMFLSSMAGFGIVYRRARGRS